MKFPTLLQNLIQRMRSAQLEEAAPGTSDAELLRRFAANRDEAAFEVLVWRHGGLVLGVCRRMLRHSCDVEDAFQATFLMLVRKASTLRHAASLAGWLHTVARRIAIRVRMRGAREVVPALGRRAGILRSGGWRY